MGEARVIPITVYVAAEDVMRAMGLPRSTAYLHLARAAGRTPGGRRQALRCPLAAWEKYAAETFGGGAVNAGETAQPETPAVPVVALPMGPKVGKAKPRKGPALVPANTNQPRPPIPVGKPRKRAEA